MGAVTSQIVWWVANLKRDPLTPKTVFGQECPAIRIKNALKWTE
jgi:hypothetical protein